MFKPIFSFVVIIFSVGFAFFYGRQEWNLVQEHRSNIVSLDETLQKSETIKKLIAETGENLKGVPKENLGRFAVFLPETIDDIRFANNIQHIGYSNSVVLENIKVDSGDKSQKESLGAKNALGVNVASAPSFSRTAGGSSANVSGALSSDKKYKTTKASFSMTTSYSSFLNFLDNLEKSLGLINITSLSFSQASQGTSGTSKKVGPLLYQFTVEIETYSLQ